MSIKGKHDKSNQNCEISTQGKFTQSRNRQADNRTRACQVLQIETTQVQIGNSNDRFYFLVRISSDRMINKLAMKNFASKGQDKTTRNTNVTKKHSCRRKKENYTDPQKTNSMKM